MISAAQRTRTPGSVVLPWSRGHRRPKPNRAHPGGDHARKPIAGSQYPQITLVTASITASSLTRRPPTNRDWHAPLFEIPRHLFAPAMNHHQRMADGNLASCRANSARGPASSSSVPPNLIRTFTADPRFPGKPSTRFMFCTACPAAPFTRLSISDDDHGALARCVEHET